MTIILSTVFDEFVLQINIDKTETLIWKWNETLEHLCPKSITSLNKIPLENGRSYRVQIKNKQEADSFKISANMPYICSKKFETKIFQKTIISPVFLTASRYFVAILNIALRR